MNYMRSGILWRIFCPTGTFRGVFSPYISFITLEGSAQQKECCTALSRIFYKSGIFLYIILVSPKGTANLRWAVWGAEGIIFFGVPRSAQ
jgi:hypothetical protein